MTGHNRRIGAWGEEIAAEYLAEHGHEILGRNIRTPHGEIDIVPQQGNITIFVEVKTLTHSTEILPEHNITPRKREHMLAAALYYASENEIDHWQIDVIAVEGNPGNNPRITHFENAL